MKISFVFKVVDVEHELELEGLVVTEQIVVILIHYTLTVVIIMH